MFNSFKYNIMAAQEQAGNKSGSNDNQDKISLKAQDLEFSEGSSGG